jgi:hypothetical protein
LVALLFLPDATLSHMVKECRNFFSAFLCSKNVSKSHVFLWCKDCGSFAN